MLALYSFSSDERFLYTLQSAARGSSHVTKRSLQQEDKGGKKVMTCLTAFTAEVASCPVTTLELSPCQQFLVTGDTKGVISVFDARTLKEVQYVITNIVLDRLTLANFITLSFADYLEKSFMTKDIHFPCWICVFLGEVV